MDISILVDRLSGELDDQAYKASDQLAKEGSSEVINAMIELLGHPSNESKIVASRTLGLIANNEMGLDPLLNAIDSHQSIAGDLMNALEGFDLSSKYITIFKYSLSKSFKVATIAQDLLDHKEFDITARVIKKVSKAWSHYKNNVKHDEVFEIMKLEVEQRIDDLNAFLDKG